MLVNYHVHNHYTTDAQGTEEDACKEAVQNGIEEICFTNHVELDDLNISYKYSITDKDWQKHIKQIEKARKKFPNLKIKLGVELGYGKHETEIVDFTHKYPFDFVLGSLHYDNHGRYWGDRLPGNPKELTNNYFQMLNKMIDLGVFDCIGHFDLVKKRIGKVPLSLYKDKVAQCIESMKRTDTGFELNTGGWYHPVNEPYPSPEILEMLYEGGIRKVTIGTDAHKPKYVSENIQRGLDILKSVGFKEIYTFNQRKPTSHPIE
jgi:histidinol-phosphatase (PHP family)